MSHFVTSSIIGIEVSPFTLALISLILIYIQAARLPLDHGRVGVGNPNPPWTENENLAIGPAFEDVLDQHRVTPPDLVTSHWPTGDSEREIYLNTDKQPVEPSSTHITVTQPSTITHQS